MRRKGGTGRKEARLLSKEEKKDRDERIWRPEPTKHCGQTFKHPYIESPTSAGSPEIKSKKQKAKTAKV